MRCLALAKAWQARGGRVAFLMAETIPDLNQRLQSEGISWDRLNAAVGSREDAQLTLAFARKTEASWVVVDGYRFLPEYIQILKAVGMRALQFDDDGRFERYEADVVLNSNIAATPDQYRARRENTQLLLGSEYILLRPEFLAESRSHDVSPVARRILVTMGGSDAENVTWKVMRALLPLRGEYEVRVVIGAGNPNLGSLQKLVENPESHFVLEQNPSNMAPLMHGADLAISAAGGTCWELAYLGVPAILIVLSSDQVPNAEALSRSGAAENLGWHANLSPQQIRQRIQNVAHDMEKRRAMSASGRKLVDGKGAERVVDFLLSQL